MKEEIVHRGAEGRGEVQPEAYINPRICGPDKEPRTCSCDNSHGHHHRHSMGKVSSVDFPGYEALLDQFQREVTELWRNEDDQGN